MKLLSIGLSHHSAPIDLREKFYMNEDRLSSLLTYLQDQPTEVAILSTCNRFEIYAVTEHPIISCNSIIDFLCQYFNLSQDELRQHLYIYHDEEVANHLMRVASGLDSMLLGEPQILGQVNKALHYSRSIASTGTILNRLFHDSLHTGKRARHETTISHNAISLSHVAIKRVLQDFDYPKEARVLILGAGEMAKSAIVASRHYGISEISLINRTYAHATALADQFQIHAYDWCHLWERLIHDDIVIVATGATQPIILTEDMRSIMYSRHQRPLSFVDVSVPRNVEASIKQLAHISYIDIDDLQKTVDDHLAQRQACIPQVETIIAEETEKFMAWLASRKVAPTIKDLREKVQNTVHTELEDTLIRLSHLSTEDKAILERFAHRVINKVLHDPTVNLRETATNPNADDYSQLIRELFALPPVNITDKR